MDDKWRARWIWLHQNRKLKNCFVEFRKLFAVDRTEKPLIINVSARNEYMLYINGHFIGRGPSPCDSMWQYYDSYDITGWIVTGLNLIAATCYHFGEDDIVTNQQQGEAGFIAQIASGDNCILNTDGQWKCRSSPRWSGSTGRISKWGGFREIYLANMEDGWDKAEFDDSRWDHAVELAEPFDKNSPWPNLIKREIPYLHHETVKPEGIVRTEANFGQINMEANSFDASFPGSMPSVVLDFGREVVGRPVLKVSAPRGGVLRLAYGESLELQYVDAFIMKEGINLLKPFGRRAFRFLQLTFSATPEPVLLRKAEAELVHYAFKESGAFKCSDALLNDIWETSRYTTLLNSQDHLEDCPWREKALWIVDAVVMGKVIYHVFGDTALLRKCLLQAMRIQNRDGSIPGTGPERNGFMLPDFCAYWLQGVLDYLDYSDDREFVLDLWPKIKRLTGWFEAQLDDTGLFGRADRQGWWCFIDWSNDIRRKDKVAAISFLYYKILKGLSEKARFLDKEEDAAKYGLQAEKLSGSIRKHLWIPEKRLYSDCMEGSELSESTSMQTNFLAIWCGLMEAGEKDHFLGHYYKNKLLPEIRGPFFQHIVLEVLLADGRQKEALDLIKRYWGEMLSRGATTWWETFDESSRHCTIPSTYQGNTPTYLYEDPPVSLCHGWGASPAYILDNIVLGVNVSKLGQGILLLDNPNEQLEWAHGEIPTKYGPVKVQWNKKDGAIGGSIAIPEGIEAIRPKGYLLDIRQEHS